MCLWNLQVFDRLGSSVSMCISTSLDFSKAAQLLFLALWFKRANIYVYQIMGFSPAMIEH